MLLAFRIGHVGLLFVASALIARELGPADRAEYALSLTFAATVWIFTHLSLDAAAARLLAHRRIEISTAAGHLATGVILVSIGGPILTVALGALIRPALADPALLTLFLAGLTIPGHVTLQMAGHLLALSGRLRATGVSYFAAALVQIGGVLGLILANSLTVVTAMAVTSASFLVGALAMIAGMARVVGLAALRPKLDVSLARSLLRIGAQVHPGSVAAQVAFRLDLLVVGALSSDTDAGLYSLALTLADAVFFVPRTLALAALQRQTKEDHSPAVAYTVRFTKWIGLLSVGLAAVAVVVADPAIVAVFGSAWRGTIVPFIVLAGALLAVGIEVPLRNILVRIAPPWTLSVASLALVLANVGGTVVLTIPFGITGAAIASVLAYWLYAGILIWFVVRYGTSRSAGPLAGVGSSRGAGSRTVTHGAKIGEQK
jgi:O-antigen/teichoic acid export membrane protein